MSGAAWLQFLVLVALAFAATPLLGSYMAKVFGGGAAPGDRFFGPAERLIYRLTGVDPSREQRWTIYARSLLAFSAVSVLALYLLQRVQGGLPVNPTDVPGVPEPLAFNTAVSFVTNTNWQNYAGETTMSHLTQMMGLAVQNFVSAAVGIAVAVALIRGLVRRRSATIGNFWVDLTRSTTRVLLPISIIGALVLASQGVIQNLGGFVIAHTLDGAVQLIPGGPAASQEAIKELGTNGGGFLNANSGHPFGSPNGFTNMFELFLILLIPFALTYTFGKLAKDRRQGWAVFAAMFLLWAASAVVAQAFETNGNPELDALGANQDTSAQLAGGGNYEGKEVRFGPATSGLFAATTTGTSTGAVIAAHDSFTPGGGAVPLVNMMLGEVSPGGVGAGLYGMLIFALLSVFIAGLMVGRTPEYLGKKIQGPEMKLITLYILAMPIIVLVLIGISVVMDTSQGLDPQLGSSRAHRGRLRLHVGRQQQRLGIRGPDGQHRLVQHDARPRDARRPVPAHRARPGPRRIAGPQADRAPFCRHVPHRHPTVRRPAHRRGCHRRGPDLLPRAVARPDRRATWSVKGIDVSDTTITSEPPRRKPGAAPRIGSKVTASLFDPTIVKQAVRDSFRKLTPRLAVRNPVMFVVWVGSIVTAILFFRDVGDATAKENVFAGLVAAWLWFTVLFANFAEAMAEGRGKAQADTLRKARAETIANRRLADGSLQRVPSSQLDVDDVVVVSAGEMIPSDGEIIAGIASVDESAITGESAPVIRESGGDRSAVTGGTRVLSDQIVVRITARPGETFLDRMIALVEGASRQKTPNEIALNILLAGLTIIFLLATVTLQPLAIYSGAEQTVIVLIALLVCLIPTTIGALLSAIGIAGMDRLVQHNVLAMSGRAVEAAGDCSTLLLDKTGTITLGNRQAAEFLPLAGVSEERLAAAAQLASLADETPEGRSIVVLAKQRFNVRERDVAHATLVPFTAQTRMSGLDIDGTSVRKGAADSVRAWVLQQGGRAPDDLAPLVEGVATAGGTPLVVAEARMDGVRGGDGDDTGAADAPRRRRC